MWPDDLVARFPGAKKRSKGGSWDVRCPVHEEQHASATLTVNGERAVISCMVCRNRMPQSTYFESMLAATGMQAGDWFRETAGRSNGRRTSTRRRNVNIEDIYPYRDADANLVFQVVRYRDEQGKKTFRARRPRTTEDKTEPGDDAAWVWERPTVDVMDGGWLYNYPEICKRSTQPVIVTEGEKDADALMAVGLLATTNAFGAGNWGIPHARHLAGRRVVVCEDNDDAGVRRSGFVMGTLIVAGAAEIRWLQFPDLPAGGDVTDFLYAAAKFTPTKPYHKPAEVFATAEARTAAKSAIVAAVRDKGVVWQRVTAGTVAK